MLIGSLLSNIGGKGLVAAGVAEAAAAAAAVGEVVHEVERRTGDGLDEQLGDALAEGDGVGRVAAVPDGYFQLALVVAVDEAGEVAQYQAVFVAEAGAGAG